MKLIQIIKDYSSRVINVLPRPSHYLYSLLLAGILLGSGCKSHLEERLKEMEIKTGHTFSENGRNSFLRQDYRDCSSEMFDVLVPFIKRHFACYSQIKDSADPVAPIFMNFYVESNGTIEYARKMADILQGNEPFVDLISLTNFNCLKSDPQLIKKFAELKNINDEFIFNTLDLYLFLNSGGTFSSAKKDIEEYPQIDGFTLYRCSQLGIELQETLTFADTDKPNAIFIFGKEDDLGALEQSEINKFFKFVHQHYDIWPVLNANTEDNLYSAINKIPNIDLLVIAAHGTRSSDKVCLGYGEEKNIAEEKYNISFGDKELPKYLEKLSSAATILLISCLAGKGDKEGDNIANFFIKSANGRTVISPNETIIGEDIVSKYNPVLKKLEIKFMKKGKDITYTNK